MRQLRLGAVALMVAAAAVARVGEPDRVVGLDNHAVRRVQRLAVELVGQHRDRPVILGAGDAARALFGRDQAALAVAGVAVDEV